MDVVNQKIEVSSEAEVEISLDAGMVAKVEFKYKGKLGGAGAYGYVPAVDLVDKLTDLIPGEIDDTLLDNWIKKLADKKTNA